MFISIFITFILFIIISKYYKDFISNDLLSFFVIIILLITYWFLKIVSKVIVEINVGDKTLEISRKYLMFNTFIKIDFFNIKNYKYEKGNGYDIFGIKLKKGFGISLLIEIDKKNHQQFSQFIKEFENKIEVINMNNYSKITKSLTIYESKWGFIYAVIIAILLISIPLLFFFKIKFNFPLILILYPSGLFYLYRFYLQRKK